MPNYSMQNLQQPFPPQGSPPPGGAAPGAADIARMLAATGNAGAPPPPGGAYGQQAPGALSSGMPPQWNPTTMIPPNMGQYGMSPQMGLMGSLPGTGAVPPVPPGTQAGMQVETSDKAKQQGQNRPKQTVQGKARPQGQQRSNDPMPKPHSGSEGQMPWSAQPAQSRYGTGPKAAR